MIILRSYSSQRYYECDNTPARDVNNKSYRCCTYHTAKFIKKYKFDPTERC